MNGAVSDTLIIVVLTLVAVSATLVVATNDPERQAITLSVLGLVLTVFFFVLQAPDVALSQLAVGTAVLPLMVMLAIRTVQRVRRGGDGDGDGDQR